MILRSFDLTRRTELCKLYGYRYGIEFERGVASMQRLRMKDWACSKLGEPHTVRWSKTYNQTSGWYYGVAKPYSQHPDKDLLWIVFKDPNMRLMAMMF